MRREATEAAPPLYVYQFSALSFVAAVILLNTDTRSKGRLSTHHHSSRMFMCWFRTDNINLILFK
jgi:hypothetical protein